MFRIVSSGEALKAELSLKLANSEMIKSINRLASGNRLSSSSDDIAAMAMGMSLQNRISTLTANLQNISQAGSLLAIADGGLSNAAEILTSMQSLASQAMSSATSSSDRTVLNAEFQQYITQLDSLANTTKFNDLKLLDGTLKDSSVLLSDASQDSNSASGVGVLVTALADTNTISIAGTTFTARTVISATPLLDIDLNTNTTADQQITAMVSQIGQILTYNGTDSTILAAKANLSKYDISKTGTATFTVTAKAGGTTANSAVVQTNHAAAGFTLNGVNAGASAGLTLSSGTAGALASGSFSTTTTAFSGTATTITTGTIGDSVLRAITNTTQNTTGVDTSNIANNPDFIGTINNFSASYVSANVINLSLTVGDYTYVANNVRTDYTSNTTVTLYSQTDGGGSLALQFAANAGSAVNNQNDASSFAGRINTAFSGLTFSQKREITNFSSAGYVYPTGDTTASGDLSGTKFYMVNDDFSNVKMQDVSVTYSAAGNAVITFKINDETYTSGYDYNGASRALTNTITSTSGSGGDGKIGFVSSSNPNHILIMDYASSTNLEIDTAAKAEGLEGVLKQAFGIGDGSNNVGISFQLGNDASEKINVTIGSVKSTSLFVNSGSAYQALDLTSTDNATNANSVLSDAINKVAEIAANVGALQSRFNYAQNIIDVTISNLDNAKSSLLDTDIAQETLRLAQYSAMSEAATAALAQTINMQKSILKLLG